MELDTYFVHREREGKREAKKKEILKLKEREEEDNDWWGERKS